MHTPHIEDFTAALADLVADGTVKRVDGPKGIVFVVPAPFYKNLMTDALAWRRLVQQKIVEPSTEGIQDLPSTESLAAAAFGPSNA
jgi:hypothetical protein